MKVHLAYGKEGLEIDVPDTATILRQKKCAGVIDVEQELVHKLDNPIGKPSLKKAIQPDMNIVVVHTDSTRATPNPVILPVLLEYLVENGIAPENITLINALGTHRFQTKPEMEQLLGEEIVSRYRCLQHDCKLQEEMVFIGNSSFSHRLEINRQVLNADLRILTGFIEPHFFAGFSGGPKAILPGIASAQTIQNNHSYSMIANPSATFGVTNGNPVWEEMMEAVNLSGPSFLLNVTLNTQGEITNIFTGDVREAHKQGCRFVKDHAMVAVDQPFDIVVTTNSGHPLDQNLYQSVKGISAANQIVRNGGAILLAARCLEGLPDHGGYARLLREAGSSKNVIDILSQPNFEIQDQWTVQVQAQVQENAKVYVYSEGLSDQQIQQALFFPCHSIEQELARLMKEYGERLCILPDGPLVIPFINRVGDK